MNRIASMRILSRVRLPVPMALWKYYHRKLFGLHGRLLGIRTPLPPFTDYSVTADFANLMISEILEHKPSLIVEAGSGLSTIIAAYCLKQLGRGFLIALEHEKRYLELCQSAILEHGLQEYVRVVHAPLTRLKLGDREWLWYEPAFKNSVTTIDLLLVDGPPGDVQSLSRYPMLPILFDSLGEKALILMDDGARADEKDIVARWAQEYGCFDATYIASEKGSIRLQRRPSHEAEAGAPDPPVVVMTTSSESYRREVAAARAHTADYGTSQEFRKYWLGFTAESRNLRAQQLRVLGELLGGVVDTLAGWRILDVGCGDGRWLRTLVEFDARPEDMVGIDVSDVRFEIGRAKNPLVKLVQTDGLSIPFDAEHFDLATQFVCFSNIPSSALRKHTAQEMGRVLKRGGYIFWWDLRSATAPTDPGARIEPTDYFDWPIARREIGPHPRPSEALRYFPGVRFVRAFVDRLSAPATYTAALIGPKP